MGNTKRYWSGLSELNQSEDFKETLEHEFPEVQSVDDFLNDEKLGEVNAGRRDFLKFMGFSVAAATLAACETPVVKSIPYVNKPETVTPGVPNYYASTYYDGNNYANVLVKTREGRPIFIKPNLNAGAQAGVKPQVNASVLGLYDQARVTEPMKGGAAISWSDLDKEVSSALASGTTAILTNTVLSPTKQRAINELKAAYGAQHVQVDSISYSGMRKANQSTFGESFIPTYHFDKAKVVVSFGADFLGTWLNSTAYESAFAKTRIPEGKWMSKHFQVESNLTLTGSNADVRIAAKPSEVEALVAGLYGDITGSGQKMSLEGKQAQLSALVKALKGAQGESIVIADSNNPKVQMVVNAINQELGNYGSTIDKDNGIKMFQGDDEAMAALVGDMKAGRINNLIIDGVNPAYTWTDSQAFIEGLAKVKMSVSTSLFADETASRCTYIAPDHHSLESWGDLQITNDRVDLVQPTIQNLFDSRPAGESFIKWAGNEDNYYTYLRKTYDSEYNDAKMYSDDTWNKSVYAGYVELGASEAPVVESLDGDAPQSVGSMSVGGAIAAIGKSGGAGYELALYQKVGLGDGSQAANPWLHELPDPVTKVCWDNYVTMSREDMEGLGLEMEISQRVFPDVVKVTVDGESVMLPAVWQPGQAKGTIGIAFGYGRGKDGENIGKAAFQTKENGSHEMDENGNLIPIGASVTPFTRVLEGSVIRTASGVTVEKTEEKYAVATTQMHHTYMGRESVVKETSYSSYTAEKDAPKGKASWNKMPALVVHDDIDRDGDMDASDKKYTKEIDLWKEHPVEGVGHRWGMTVDLTACTGCGSCVTACHIENNVPVVGKDEVRRHRDMHWLRIDRFYSSDWSLEKGEEEGVGVIDSYGKMEVPSDNPQTVHMPMMCQHCNHAPCETVCPVAATTHSNEGLNQMTYNRCIGTRYCANNCPYKVRRFNWFNYIGYKKFQNVNPSQDSLARMVLNPDVTVRSRGVMEKCSMCVQRIQAGKLEAKVNGMPVEDGAISSACSEACPSNAISFGDLNDTKSNVTAISKNNRSYHALEEIGVQPNIFYMTKVRNIEEETQA
ncbi:MAG: TAT-variant-translocated molybdopterin oxidoreductase [Flavobacteriales bacterium]|nr:TAT-variant-translocated molybdopterin oxidoreductase [Flavobacteriales bacterium]